MTKLETTPPTNRLGGSMPKIGIRPTIDGRLGGVRESLEVQTMNMAKAVAEMLESNSAPCQRPARRVRTRRRHHWPRSGIRRLR